MQVQVHVVPVEKAGVAGAEGGGSGDANEGEEPPRKRAKVMLLQVMRKGTYVCFKCILYACEIIIVHKY